MKTIIIALGLAIALAFGAELMSSYLGRLLHIDPEYYWLVAFSGVVIGLATAIWGIYRLATKKINSDIENENIIVLVAEKGKPIESKLIVTSRFGKILKWLRDN